MKLILTSFGVNEEKHDVSQQDLLFYRMPPVEMRGRMNDVFVPDYAALLLCDRLIVDKSTFALLKEKPHRSYALIAETLILLHEEGFVDIVDFDEILDRNHGFLKKMLEYDLNVLDQWVDPLKHSIEIWRGFVESASSAIQEEIHLSSHSTFYDDVALSEILQLTKYHPYFIKMLNIDAMKFTLLDEALDSSPKCRQSRYRAVLRDVLVSYLSYVNANLVLSNELETGFHDWADFLPFYRQKFLSIGRKNRPEQRCMEELDALFSISFPEFTIRDPKSLVRILRDRRVVDLRQLVQDAVDGKVVFDVQFARNVFREVLRTERKTSRYRTLVSYLTMPLDLLGFLPGVGAVVQKGVEEAAGLIIDKKLRKTHRWFYMLSDVIGEGDA